MRKIMPTMKVTETVPANGSLNLLQGEQFEYLPRSAKVQFAILVDTGDQVRATVYSGSDLLLQNAPLDEKVAAEPVTTRDIQLDDVALAGERLSIQVQETQGVAARVRAVVWITYAG